MSVNEDWTGNAAAHEPLVRVFKDYSKGGNGSFAVVTTANDPLRFLCAATGPVLGALEANGDDEVFTLDELLPLICELWARLKGYKSDRVHEERRLVAGPPNPEGSMHEVGRGARPPLFEAGVPLADTLRSFSVAPVAPVESADPEDVRL